MLEIINITVETKNGRALLTDFSAKIGKGSVLGLTGESGAGKSTVIKSIMGILGHGSFIKSGSIILDGKDISKLSPSKRRDLCGIRLGFIPQNPMTAFSSRKKIGKEMRETFCCRLNMTKNEGEELSRKVLEKVYLKDTERILESLPTQLSGGMLQRVSFAILLGLNPDYVLADEPISALDEKNRDIILKLLIEKSKESGVIMISHNIEALKTLCDNVIVLKDGFSIEKSSVQDLLHRPKHSWTKQFAENSRETGKEVFEWETYSW